MDVKGLFDSLYDRFVSHDFFGKIVPGMIFLGAVIVSSSSWASAFKQLNEVGGWAWLAVFGIAWLTGLGLQGLGEREDIRRGFVRELPPSKDIDFRVPRGEYWDQNFWLSRLAPEPVIRTSARSGVMKEATGIGYFSLALSLLLVLADGALEHLVLPCVSRSQPFVRECVRDVMPFMGAVLVAVGLFLFHDRALEREDGYRRRLLERARQNSPVPDPLVDTE